MSENRSPEGHADVTPENKEAVPETARRVGGGI
jgi:hypothetical protein